MMKEGLNIIRILIMLIVQLMICGVDDDDTAGKKREKNEREIP